VDETPSEEPQRVLGMPIGPGRGFRLMDPTEPRVLGLPRSWYRTSSVDLSGFRHPIRWMKWRIRFHRVGPYVGDYTPPAEGSEDAKP
jgi:hypothetical protein